MAERVRLPKGEMPTHSTNPYSAEMRQTAVAQIHITSFILRSVRRMFKVMFSLDTVLYTHFDTRFLLGHASFHCQTVILSFHHSRPRQALLLVLPSVTDYLEWLDPLMQCQWPAQSPFSRWHDTQCSVRSILVFPLSYGNLPYSSKPFLDKCTKMVLSSHW